MGSLNIDAKLIFSNAQDVYAATVVSTNVLDFAVANPDLGEGRPIRVEIVVTTAFDGTGSIQFVIQDSADNSTYATLISSEVFATAIAAGTKYVFTLPDDFARYLRLNYVIVNSSTSDPVTTGAVTTYLTGE